MGKVVCLRSPTRRGFIYPFQIISRPSYHLRPFLEQDVERTTSVHKYLLYVDSFDFSSSDHNIFVRCHHVGQIYVWEGNDNVLLGRCSFSCSCDADNRMTCTSWASLYFHACCESPKVLNWQFYSSWISTGPYLFEFAFFMAFWSSSHKWR